MPLSTFLAGDNPGQLRGIAWLSLSDTCVVQSRSGASDSGGGITDTWGTAGTFACRIDPAGGRAGGNLVGGAINERTTHVVTAPSGSTVTAGERVVVSGGTFEVTATHERTREWASSFEVVQI